MEPLRSQTIAEYAGGRIRQGDGSCLITNVVTDSRQLQAGELFLALVGDHFNGHHFVAQAQSQGAAGVIVARDASLPALPPHFIVIEVDDTLLAYQNLAAAYRQTLPLRVVGITGSNGKTTTKDFAAAVLARKFRVLKTEGNFNNHIGVPRSLLWASTDDEIAVLELGMNHPGEIRPLAEMIKPEVAIITNIGTAHIEHMGSREAIAREKGELFKAISMGGHAIFPVADPFAAELSKNLSAKLWTVGLESGDVRAENAQLTPTGNEFEVVYDGCRFPASLVVPGEHMIINALLGITAGLAFGMALPDAIAGLSTALLTKGRLERRFVGNLQIIDDSYNANPDSMLAALATLASLPTGGRRFAVLGKMAELGAHSEAGHRLVGAAAAKYHIDCVISVGVEAEAIAQTAKQGGVKEVYTAGDVCDAAKILQQIVKSSDLILLKGSRSAGMERVIAALEVAQPVEHFTTH